MGSADRKGKKTSPKKVPPSTASSGTSPIFADESQAEPAPAGILPDFWYIWAGIFIVGLLLRTFDIDLRPLHNDEGVNYFFIESIGREGFFRYSHENYHGPSYFYLTTLCTLLFGDAEFGLRSSAIFAGLAVLALPLFLRRLEGDLFVLIATALLALSSSLVFYSRYAIHEMLFLFSGGLMAIGMYRWHVQRLPRDVYIAAVGLAILIATKETFIISVASIGLGLLMVGVDRRLINSVREQKAHFVLASLIVVILVSLQFTGGLQWGGGLREMFLAVPQWIGRNKSDTGHFKPFIYYAKVFKQAEPQIFLALALPLVLFLSRPQEMGKRLYSDAGAFFRFTFSWALSSWLIYSVVNYKTPWLIISVVLPAVLVIAKMLSDFDRLGRGFKTCQRVVLAVALIIASYFAYAYNFKIAFGNDNPYSYVHTSQGMVEMIADLEDYFKKRGGPGKILVGVEQYWPLPYYLKPWAEKGLVEYLNVDDNYLKGGPNGTRDPSSVWSELKSKYQVLMVNKDKIWDDPNWGRRYYRFSDVQESQTYKQRSAPEQVKK